MRSTAGVDPRAQSVRGVGQEAMREDGLANPEEEVRMGWIDFVYFLCRRNYLRNLDSPFI